MKILFAAEVFYPEPIAMSAIIVDMATKISKQHAIDVITPKPCRPLGYTLPERIDDPNWTFNRYVLKSFIYPKTSFFGRALESISFGHAAKKYLRAHHDYDVVYAAIHPLFAQKKLVKVCKKYNIPIIVHVEDIYPEPFLSKLHGYLGKILYMLFLPMDKYILQNSSKVIAIGPKLREYLIETRSLDSNKVKYVYNWQDDERFSNTPDTINDDLVFTYMFVGSLSMAANLIYIINCYIEANPTNTRLVFAGSGSLKEKLKQIANDNANVNIEFWDAQFDKIPEIQKQANILLLPLKKTIALRAFPSKFPSYLFSKKPVLACVEHKSDVADCIKQANCGWVVDPDDTTSLIQLFKILPLKKSDELKSMGQSGFEYSQKNLTKEVNMNKLVNIIIDSSNNKI